MANRPFKFMSGEGKEAKVDTRADDSVGKFDTLHPWPGESLGSIAFRAYGANTPENRDKIERANSTLNDNVRIPR